MLLLRFLTPLNEVHSKRKRIKRKITVVELKFAMETWNVNALLFVSSKLIVNFYVSESINSFKWLISCTLEKV